MRIISLFYSTCVLSGIVQNLRLNFASALLRGLPIASTQLCAFQTCLLAFALLDAALQKFAGDKVPDDLACCGERCPNRFVQAACLDCSNPRRLVMAMS